MSDALNDVLAAYSQTRAKRRRCCRLAPASGRRWTTCGRVRKD